MKIIRTLSVLLLAGLGLGISLAPAAAANPPRIEYVLVLDAHGKPRTSFHPGNKVGFRVELYLVGRSAGSVASVWTVRTGDHTVFHRSLHGSFHGPTRGNLFTQTQTMSLAGHAPKGTYTVDVSLTVSGRQLTRTAQFYVR